MLVITIELKYSASNGESITMLGERLINLASMSSNELKEWAHLQACVYISRRIMLLEEKLSINKALPEYWQVM